VANIADVVTVTRPLRLIPTEPEEDDWGHPVLRFTLVRLHSPQAVRWRVRLGHLDGEPGGPLCLGVLTPWLMAAWRWYQ
jgi:hypothetical protein